MSTALKIAPSSLPVKLDLGGGQNVREGFECVDLNAPKAEHRVNLFRFPWPFEDSSVDEAHCSHFIEHIPAREIHAGDIDGADNLERYLGKDMLLGFFDELYRIMKPEGTATIIWPALKSERAFQDPTHRRFIPSATMAYLSADWRKANKLDHYRVDCNFASNVIHTMDNSLALLHTEVQARKFNESWNVIYDFHATLKPIK
jgi:hypothetical protein